MLFGRKAVRSKKARKEIKRVFFRVGVLVIGLSGALLVLLTQLARLPQVQIDTVSVEGLKTLSDSKIVEEVENKLEGTYFYFLFPRRTSLILPRADITDVLHEAYPRLKSITLDVRDLRELRVRVAERSPVALWCEESDAECFFVDEKGFSYASAPRFTGRTFFSIYGKSPDGVGPLIGASVLPAEEFEKLHLFVRELEGLALEPTAVRMADEYFAVSLARGGEVRFAYANDYTEQFRNMRDVLSAQVLKTAEGERRLDIDYIDMRFGNKVYFKLLDVEHHSEE